MKNERYIVGRKNKTIHSSVLDTLDDHRVLSASVLAARLNQAEEAIGDLNKIVSELKTEHISEQNPNG